MNIRPIFLTLILALASNLLAAKEIRIYKDEERHYFTINNEIPITGPVYQVNNEKAYVSEIYHLILKVAADLASEYRLAGDSVGYNAFLIGALTVPFHESKLLHFKSLSPLGNNCNDKFNSGSVYTQNEISGIFKRNFRDNLILKDCSEYNQNASYNRLLIGNGDVGIFQLNLRWHEANYFAPKHHLNVESTIRYGLRYFKEGFDKIYRNAQNYPCLVDGNNVIPKNIIRGAWSGKYNSGNTGETCRFSDSNDDRDVAFEIHLNNVLNINSDYSENLNTTEIESHKELIKNFIDNNKQYQRLDKIIANTTPAPVKKMLVTPAIPAQVIAATSKKSDELKKITKVYVTIQLNYRDQPGNNSNILGSYEKGAEVQVLETFKVSAASAYPWLRTDKGWIYAKFVKTK